MSQEQYNFTKFENTGGRYESRITVTASRSFGFPTKFYKDNKIKDYKYVVLYYDRDKRAVGFKFTNDSEEEHKFSLIKSNKGYGASVVATSFFKANNLKAKEIKGRYEWEKHEMDGVGSLYVIELRDGQNSPASKKESLS